MTVGTKAPQLDTYEQAVAYFESLLRAPSYTTSEDDLRRNFARTGCLLDHMGSPHLRFPSVHIAGTSGKGSTTALIGAILQAAGLRTGVHCTPYIQAPTERMRVGDYYASKDDFARLVREMYGDIVYMQERSPFHEASYLETAVAQAFQHFAQSAVDIAAIEVGMGGRYDSTNHIMPLVSAIVTVDYDHIVALGPTLDRIAYHKAGIIKPGVPVVTGISQPTALRVIEDQALAVRSDLHRIGRDITFCIETTGPSGSTFGYSSPWSKLAGLQVGMLGRHQVLNASLAVSMAELLRLRGWPITDDAIRRGLSLARMPGRLEVIQRSPSVILDGAHNPEKMRSLASALHDLFPGQKPVLVLGVLAAKDAQHLLAEVVPLARCVVVTSPTVLHKPAVAPDALAAACRQLGSEAIVEPDLPVAIARAKDIAGRDGLVCVSGSLYMVGQARNLWIPAHTILEQRTSFPAL